MPATEQQLERTVELKQNLVEFARTRYRREYRIAAEQRFGRRAQVEQPELIGFVDDFVMTHTLRSGETIVEAYLAAHPELPDDDRAILLGWRNPVTGIFRVERFSGEAVILLNLVDELRYRVRSNYGKAGLRQLRPAWYVVARIVPLADEWSISGNMRLRRPADRTMLVQFAWDHAMRHPEEAFRNPERLAKAFEIQREQHERFVEYFGDALLILPAAEVEGRINEFQQWAERERRAALARTGVELAATADRELPVFELDAGTLAVATTGVVSDPIEGMMFYPDLGDIVETFKEPRLASERKQRVLVRDLLADCDFGPVILRMLAERHPDTVNDVLGKVFRRKDFDWERDGEALMRELQPAYYASPRWPSVTVIGDDVSALADDPRPAKKAGGRRRS